MVRFVEERSPHLATFAYRNSDGTRGQGAGWSVTLVKREKKPRPADAGHCTIRLSQGWGKLESGKEDRPQPNIGWLGLWNHRSERGR